jgi:hypothetical protein
MVEPAIRRLGRLNLLFPDLEKTNTLINYSLRVDQLLFKLDLLFP